MAACYTSPAPPTVQGRETSILLPNSAKPPAKRRRSPRARTANCWSSTRWNPACSVTASPSDIPLHALSLQVTNNECRGTYRGATALRRGREANPHDADGSRGGRRFLSPPRRWLRAAAFPAAPAPSGQELSSLHGRGRCHQRLHGHENLHQLGRRSPFPGSAISCG